MLQLLVNTPVFVIVSKLACRADYGHPEVNPGPMWRRPAPAAAEIIGNLTCFILRLPRRIQFASSVFLSCPLLMSRLDGLENRLQEAAVFV